jgi:hypothetical protein
LRFMPARQRAIADAEAASGCGAEPVDALAAKLACQDGAERSTEVADSSELGPELGQLWLEVLVCRGTRPGGTCAAAAAACRCDALMLPCCWPELQDAWL